MKYIRIEISTIIVILLLVFNSISFSERPVNIQVIKLKLGTMAPRGTTPTVAVDLTDEFFDYLGGRIGTRIKIIGYYGSVMGDDPQMIQKAKTGQLDMVTCTINALPYIAREFEVFNMAFLIEDYGQFDYVMTKNSVYINDLFYKNGWISLGLITSEGPHNLYLKAPLRTPQELKDKVKAANYAPGADSSFYKAFGIPDFPVQPSEMFPSVKAGVVNAGILPSAFVIGMQLYSTLHYVVIPPIRYPTSAIILSKKKWLTFPWKFRIYFAALQPITYLTGTNFMRDGAYAYFDAIINYGCTPLTLTSKELNTWKKIVKDYQKTFLGDDQVKLDAYNRITKSINEYNTTDTIQKQIFENDPTSFNALDAAKDMKNAILSYYKSGSKAKILELTEKKFVPKSFMYDWVVACENYISSGKPDRLKAWFKSFYISDVVDEIFTDHMDSIKELYGTKAALRDRIQELYKFYSINTQQYIGFQKSSLGKNKK